jgi:hypothetical protein
MQQKTKTFGIRLLLLIVVLVVLDQTGGRILDHYYLRVKGGSEYKTVYGLEKSSEDLLIMGSSRAYHHYVTANLEQGLGLKSYNLGRDGAGILYNYALYNTICERKKPALVIMDINPEEFAAPNVSYQLLSQLLPHYDKSRYVKEVVQLRSPFEWLKAQSHLYRYNSQLFYIALNNVQTSGLDASKGYLPLYGTVQGSPKLIVKNEPVLDTLLLRYFERFLITAKENNTQMLVCISPAYRKYQQMTLSLEKVYELCRRHGVLVLDHLQDEQFLGHPGYFRDPSHLNDTGAHVYTQLVLEALLRSKIIGGS